jgi:hypothetical protein
MVAVEVPAAQPAVGSAAIRAHGAGNQVSAAPFLMGASVGQREHPECATATHALVVSFIGLFVCGALAPVAIFLAYRARAIIALNPGMRGMERVNVAFIVSAITMCLWAVGVARFSRMYFPAHHP